MPSHFPGSVCLVSLSFSSRYPETPYTGRDVSGCCGYTPPCRIRTVCCGGLSCPTLNTLPAHLTSTCLRPRAHDGSLSVFQIHDEISIYRSDPDSSVWKGELTLSSLIRCKMNSAPSLFVPDAYYILRLPLLLNRIHTRCINQQRLFKNTECSLTCLIYYKYVCVCLLVHL